MSDPISFPPGLEVRHPGAEDQPRRFFHDARERGACRVECITSPGNAASLAFHTRLGFGIVAGDHVVDGVAVQSDYDGPRLDRVVFVRPIDDGPVP